MLKCCGLVYRNKAGKPATLSFMDCVQTSRFSYSYKTRTKTPYQPDNPRVHPIRSLPLVSFIYERLLLHPPSSSATSSLLLFCQTVTPSLLLSSHPAHLTSVKSANLCPTSSLGGAGGPVPLLRLLSLSTTPTGSMLFLNFPPKPRIHSPSSSAPSQYCGAPANIALPSFPLHPSPSSRPSAKGFSARLSCDAPDAPHAAEDVVATCWRRTWRAKASSTKTK